MRVGIAGLGKMGSIFADRIKAAGHELAVWNRTPEKAKAVVGASAAASPADLASGCEIVLTIVSDDAAVTEVYEGAGGLLSGDVAGRLFVEMSTVQPATHARIGKVVEAAGGRFIECPVGGSVKVASEGKLLGFAGGAEARHQPAALGLLAGARRGGVAHRRLWLRPELADRVVLRKLGRTERAEGTRAQYSQGACRRGRAALGRCLDHAQGPRADAGGGQGERDCEPARRAGLCELRPRRAGRLRGHRLLRLSRLLGAAGQQARLSMARIAPLTASRRSNFLTGPTRRWRCRIRCG